MAKFGIHEVCDVTLYDLSTGKPFLYLDTLKISSLENAAESVSATGGRGNANLITWEFGRTATFTMQDALLDTKSLAALTGNTLSIGATTLYGKEIVTGVTSLTPGQTTLTISKTLLANTVYVNKVVDGDNMGDEVPVVSASGSAIEVSNTNIGNGVKAMVFYQYTSPNTVQKITISTDKFPQYFKVIGETIVRNESTGVDEGFQIHIPKAKLKSNFTITMEAGGDPSVFDFVLDAYRPSDSADMIYLYKI